MADEYGYPGFTPTAASQQLYDAHDAEREMPVHEYALMNGLTIDSQIHPFNLVSVFMESLAALCDDAGPDGMICDDSLPALQIPRHSSLIQEHESFESSRDSTDLLERVTSREFDDAEASAIMSRLTSKIRKSELRLETPLLSTDTDCDVMALAEMIHKKKRVDLGSIHLPMERIDVRLDETLAFPEKAHAFNKQLQQSLRVEKLSVTKTAFALISQVLRGTQKSEHRALVQEHLRSIKPKGIRSREITPPLILPKSPTSPFIPGNEACSVPLAPKSPLLREEDLAALETELLKEDLSPEEASNLESVLAEYLPPLNERNHIRPKIRRIESFKLEEPLLPTVSPPSPFMPNLRADKLVDPAIESENTNLSATVKEHQREDVFDGDLLHIMEQSAKKLDRNIEKERLDVNNALARMPVPELDFSVSAPCWQSVAMTPKSQLTWIMKQYNCSTVPKWQSPRGFIPERSLNWVPFPPKLGRITITESINEEDVTRSYIRKSSLDEVPRSADYVWKQPGLAILQDDDDEDYDEYTFDLATLTKENESLEVLTRKRRLGLLTRDESSTPSISSTGFHHVRLMKEKSEPASPEAIQSSRIAEGTPLSGFLVGSNDSSATSTLLSNFIDFRTTKRQKHNTSTFFPVSPAENTMNETVTPRLFAAKADDSHQTAPKRNETPKGNESAPLPTLNLPEAKTKIIKSLNLSRKVFTRLETLYPTAEIIERDFDRWNTLTWSNNSITRSTVASPLSMEADISISPKTGIIVTTLLKATQKPFMHNQTRQQNKTQSPQNRTTTLRDRIAAVSLRYEQLIVLVSEDNHLDETVRDLLPSECAALADFMSFTSSLCDSHSDVTVRYIGGGEEVLTHWLVHISSQHAVETGGVHGLLTHIETAWEVFLRRAGLNVYAAQAILGALKAPKIEYDRNCDEEHCKSHSNNTELPVQEIDDSKKLGVLGEQSTERSALHSAAATWGLPEFIRMTPLDRVRMFGAMMGGERVLHRVNAVLEARWG